MTTIHVNRDGIRHPVSFFKGSDNASVEKAIANAFDPPLKQNIKLFCRMADGSRPIMAICDALSPDYEYDVQGLPKGERTFACLTVSVAVAPPIALLCMKMWLTHRANGIIR